MSYCTQQNLVDRFGEQELIQLTDRDQLGVIDAAVVAQAIADATAEIDGYLTAYLPLSSVPANLVRLACDITRYLLYDDLATEQVKERYKNAIAYLTKVGEGKISIAPDSAGVIDAPAEDGVAFTASEAVFGGNALTGF